MPGGGGPGSGAGSAGTCFSGGSGGGGTLNASPGVTSAFDAEADGGKGGEGANVTSPASAAGAGNPNGNTDPAIGDDPQFDGTGGVLIIFVEGTITTNSSSEKHFTADGTYGRQALNPSGTGIYPFGGGTGGGIVIVVNNSASSYTNNVTALGGVVATGGPTTPFQSGGNGSAVCYTFSEL